MPRARRFRGHQHALKESARRQQATPQMKINSNMLSSCCLRFLNHISNQIAQPNGKSVTCPSCSGTIINDGGTWRSIHTLDPRARQKLTGSYRVQQLLKR